MIPISYSDSKGLLDIHYKSILNYLEGPRMKNKFAQLEKLIDEFSNKEYTFKSLVQASFPTIKERIVPLWSAFPTNQKVNFSKSIGLIGNLYSYLGKSKHYSFTDAGGGVIYYNTEYLFRRLNIKVCPYCNENYTYHFSNNGRRNYDLDHFYSQSEFPILAISLYNLVPSCKVCNFFKLDSDASVLSPHEVYDVDELMTYQIKPVSSDYLISDDAFSIEALVSLGHKHETSIEHNIQVFKLIERYKERRDIVYDVIRKKQIYSEEYIKQLFEQYEGLLFSSLEQVKSLVYGASLDASGYHNRPFSKLIKDVFEDPSFKTGL